MDQSELRKLIRSKLGECVDCDSRTDCVTRDQHGNAQVGYWSACSLADSRKSQSTLHLGLHDTSDGDT